MRASLLAVLVVAGLIAACSEVPSEPAGSTAVRGPAGQIIAGTCTTLESLNDLARDVFKGASPNVNSVLGKLKSLDGDVRKGKLDKAIERAHDIVDFTLKHFHAGRLPGTDEELAAFVNAVYCYAGIDIDIDEPTNSHLILPSDAPQVVYAIDGQSAIAFQANPVFEPTLIEFAQLPDTFSAPGGGPLDTKLDQYPGFITITKSSATNAPLAKPAVVGICAAGVIPQDVRDRLRLGHGRATGFELAAQGDASFLDCENLVDEVTIGALGKLANLLMPKPLQAKAFRRGGGVGGTVTEFSPFAPVDPELRSGGGVGGTVTEFTRSPGAMLFADDVLPLATCPVITAPTGMPVPKECQPFVRITTRLGTMLSQVPVTWTTEIGHGRISAGVWPDCPGFTHAIVSPTDLFGRSFVCWKLGDPGTNVLLATPAAGGDAPAGVSFVPATVTFEATSTALPPSTP